MPSMEICLQLCAFGLSLFLFPVLVAFGCIDGKHFTLFFKFSHRNVKANYSIKHPKAELTIQIYIKHCWSSGINFWTFVFHHSKICSRKKKII